MFQWKYSAVAAGLGLIGLAGVAKFYGSDAGRTVPCAPGGGRTRRSEPGPAPDARTPARAAAPKLVRGSEKAEAIASRLRRIADASSGAYRVNVLATLPVVYAWFGDKEAARAARDYVEAEGRALPPAIRQSNPNPSASLVPQGAPATAPF